MSTDTTPCKACGGTGQWLVNGKPWGTWPCPECGGTGRVREGHVSDTSKMAGDVRADESRFREVTKTVGDMREGEGGQQAITELQQQLTAAQALIAEVVGDLDFAIESSMDPGGWADLARCKLAGRHGPYEYHAGKPPRELAEAQAQYTTLQAEYQHLLASTNTRQDYLEAQLAESQQLIRNQDARDLAATERVGMTPLGCDTADWLAEEVLGLRAQLTPLLAVAEAARGMSDYYAYAASEIWQLDVLRKALAAWEAVK